MQISSIFVRLELFILTYIFKDELTEGKIEQLSHQMAENRLWEEHTDPAYHKSLFNAYGLLRKAYNGIFTEPSGVSFAIKITVNKNGIFNDDDYEYDEIGIPFLAELGRELYALELKRKKEKPH